MAFIRKRGESYYLVHNVRKEGRVRQIHLACLGHRPRISDDVVRGVASNHPFVRVDWKELRDKASRNVVQPFEHDSRYLRDLLVADSESSFRPCGFAFAVARVDERPRVVCAVDCRAQIAASDPGRETPRASQGEDDRLSTHKDQGRMTMGCTSNNPGSKSEQPGSAGI